MYVIFLYIFIFIYFQMRDVDSRYKILVLGDGFVGKTAITIRFCDDQFDEAYKMTIGVNFGSKDIIHEGRIYQLILWDVAGQQRFSFFRTQYYRGALGIILVYDKTNRLTLYDLPNWVAESQENIGQKPIVVAGNKADLPGAQVTYEEGKNFAESLNAPFFETSAKTNHNIGNMFLSLIELIRGERISNSLRIDSYDGLEYGFNSLEQLLEPLSAAEIVQYHEIDIIADAIMRLKQTIFKSNPYSCVLGNISDWIHYLGTYGTQGLAQQDQKIQLIESYNYWKQNYTQSLQDGQAVTASFL